LFIPGIIRGKCEILAEELQKTCGRPLKFQNSPFSVNCCCAIAANLKLTGIKILQILEEKYYKA